LFGLEEIDADWDGLNPQQVKIHLNPLQSLPIPSEKINQTSPKKTATSVYCRVWTFDAELALFIGLAKPDAGPYPTQIDPSSRSLARVGAGPV
jgi:hypothetical protein